MKKVSPAEIFIDGQISVAEFKKQQEDLEKMREALTRSMDVARKYQSMYEELAQNALFTTDHKTLH